MWTFLDLSGLLRTFKTFLELVFMFVFLLDFHASLYILFYTSFCSVLFCFGNGSFFCWLGFTKEKLEIKMTIKMETYSAISGNFFWILIRFIRRGSSDFMFNMRIFVLVIHIFICEWKLTGAEYYEAARNWLGKLWEFQQNICFSLYFFYALKALNLLHF